MFKRNWRLIAAGFLAALTAAVGAAQQTDVEGSKDHPLVSRYPGLVITEYYTTEFDEFTLPLGKLKTDVTLEKSQHLEGKVTRILYEGPAGRSLLEIYRNYESALTKGGFQILFACANNQGCGDGHPALYAPKGDEDWSWSAGQRYASAKLSRPAGDVYVSLHIGQWSNLDRGPAILLYVVEVQPMQGDLVTVNAAALAGEITNTGHSSVYGIYFDTGKADVKPESDAALKEIAKLLQQDGQLKLLVVGHTDNVGALASNMDLSRHRAEAVVQVLANRYGIAPARLSGQGAGPLAPVASNKSEEGRARNRRVELVEQ
ncbi:OmpA family domain-containing protein [Candidatus Sulfopaludibacter sp. SbA3]|nr:OmpA family domain-containing protein [Candidatus Sulfopaludibacter sp. SbA3]